MNLEQETYQLEYNHTIKRIRGMKGHDRFNKTFNECYLNQLDYMLPERTVYWRTSFKLNIPQRPKILTFIYLTPNSTIILEFGVGDWRAFMKMHRFETLEQITKQLNSMTHESQFKEFVKKYTR